MTETEIMTDTSEDQTGQSPLEALAEHIRNSGAGMVLARATLCKARLKLG